MRRNGRESRSCGNATETRTPQAGTGIISFNDEEVKMTMTIKKSTVYWVTVFVLQFLFILWYKGLLVPDIVLPQPQPTDSLVMSVAEAKLTKQAIEMVRNEVIEGKITSAELARQALSGELLESVRERVLKELGQPNIEFMRDALDILEGKIETRN
jgi:hypothetical protein